jgi:hypothetical protein
MLHMFQCLYTCVASVLVVSYICFTRFICMFHVFQLDVVKGSDVAYVAMAAHIVSSVCSTCFICFRRMLQMYVSAVSDICFI